MINMPEMPKYKWGAAMPPELDVVDRYGEKLGGGPEGYDWYGKMKSGDLMYNNPTTKPLPTFSPFPKPQSATYSGENITGNITMPENWLFATNYLKGLLSGEISGGGGGSGALDLARQRAEQMLGTGEPVDISGWWEAQKPLFQQQYEDTMRQMAEEAGLSGTRWSSVLQRNIADMIRRGETQLMAEAMSRQLAAEEAAKQRVLQVMGLLSQIGSSEAQAGMAASGQKLAALRELLGAGQYEAEFPLRLANALAGLGEGLYGMEQQQYGNVYNPPWLQAALNLSGQAMAGLPQTYQPSFWEQLAGAAGYIPDVVKIFQKTPSTAVPKVYPSNLTFGGLLGNWDKSGTIW